MEIDNPSSEVYMIYAEVEEYKREKDASGLLRIYKALYGPPKFSVWQAFPLDGFFEKLVESVESFLLRDKPEPITDEMLGIKPPPPGVIL